MSWPTTADGEWYIFDGQLLWAVNPETGAPMLMMRPQGGMAVGVPAIEKGDPGKFTVFQAAVDFTALEWDDPTPNSAEVIEVTPGSDTVSQVVKLQLAVHKGEPGTDGTTSLNPDSIAGSKVTGKMIKLNGTLDGFDYAYEAVAERYLPTTISNTAAGNTNSTVATVAIPARNRDCRLFVVGEQRVTQSGGTDVVVDLVARLNNQTGGNIIARCQGIGGTERLSFAPIPAAGSADSFDKVAANTAATVYIRTEQQSGANTYTTSNSYGRFGVWSIPVG
jgi:hypothetical protein